jgi:hypothetical protein
LAACLTSIEILVLPFGYATNGELSAFPHGLVGLCIAEMALKAIHIDNAGLDLQFTYRSYKFINKNYSRDRWAGVLPGESWNLSGEE